MACIAHGDMRQTEASIPSTAMFVDIKKYLSAKIAVLQDECTSCFVEYLTA